MVGGQSLFSNFRIQLRLGNSVRKNIQNTRRKSFLFPSIMIFFLPSFAIRMVAPVGEELQ